jgi:hypothetical protein
MDCFIPDGFFRGRKMSRFPHSMRQQHRTGHLLLKISEMFFKDRWHGPYCRVLFIFLPKKRWIEGPDPLAEIMVRYTTNEEPPTGFWRTFLWFKANMCEIYQPCMYSSQAGSPNIQTLCTWSLVEEWQMWDMSVSLQPKRPACHPPWWARDKFPTILYLVSVYPYRSLIEWRAWNPTFLPQLPVRRPI